MWLWVLDHKESWAWKKWCFWTVMLEKTLENPLDSKEIKLVNPKGYQLWPFIERTDAEAESPILATWYEELTQWKRPWCWKWRQEEKGMTECEVWLDGITESMDMSLSNLRSWWWTGSPGMLPSMESQSWTQLNEWTEANTVKGYSIVNESEVDFFSGILLLFLWSNRFFQNNLWFLCLF